MTDTNKQITAMIQQCETYLSLPQQDAALKQARTRRDNAHKQAKYQAIEQHNQIQAIMDSILTTQTRLANALSDRSSKLPEATAVDSMPNPTITDLEVRQKNSVKLRDAITDYLQMIDDTLRFYDTVRIVGYILLGIILLIVVFILTGSINLSAF